MRDLYMLRFLSMMALSATLALSYHTMGCGHHNKNSKEDTPDECQDPSCEDPAQDDSLKPEDDAPKPQDDDLPPPQEKEKIDESGTENEMPPGGFATVCLGDAANFTEISDPCAGMSDPDLSHGYMVDAGAPNDGNGSLAVPFNTLDAGINAILSGGSKTNLYLVNRGVPYRIEKNGAIEKKEINFYGGFMELGENQFGRDTTQKTEIIAEKGFYIYAPKTSSVFDTLHIVAAGGVGVIDTNVTLLRTNIESSGGKYGIALTLLNYSGEVSTVIDQTEIIRSGNALERNTGLQAQIAGTGHMQLTMKNSMIWSTNATKTNVAANFVKSKETQLDITIVDSTIVSGAAPFSSALLFGDEGKDVTKLGNSTFYNTGEVILERNTISSMVGEANHKAIAIGLYNAPDQAIIRNNIIRGGMMTDTFKEQGGINQQARGIECFNSDVVIINNTFFDSWFGIFVRKMDGHNASLVNNLIQTWPNGLGVLVDVNISKEFKLKHLMHNLFGNQADSGHAIYSHLPANIFISCATGNCSAEQNALNESTTITNNGGNIIADPQWIDEFQLGETSPAIDAGISFDITEDISASGQLDLNGTLRTEPWDIGAIEVH